MNETESFGQEIDWKRVAEQLLLSRALDSLEETKLVPEKKVLYQFSARGHDLAQILLGSLLSHPEDAASGYYRSRPLLLTVGLPLEDAMAGPMAKSGGFSDGRDIGVVCNLPSENSTKILPMAGGVGSQYTPTAGWAQALQYRHDVLDEKECKGAIAVALGGDGSVATNGFWSALNIATTQQLPMLFYIEDNGYGLSVPSHYQVPNGDITSNLASYKNLLIIEGDGANPEEAAEKISEAVAHARSWQGPVLLKLHVPRLCGHSGQDTQAYKSDDFISEENSRDPLPALKEYLIPNTLSEDEWNQFEEKANKTLADTLESTLNRAEPNPKELYRHRFSEDNLNIQYNTTPQPESQRTNMLTAIRRTLDSEMERNDKLLIFGEDVGPKGGVHAITMGLQDKYSDKRVFDTSLSEEGIIGRALGMAYAGLKPVPEIQFRKYADSAQEHLMDCATVRWRTNNRFSAPMVVRTPGGFSKCGDPWHSMSNEVAFAHALGWQVVYPSNAEDAVGLLRTALRGDDPVFFFEHRGLLDAAEARRPYPGDDYSLPFGQANVIQTGSDLTIITWGAMVDRCEQAAKQIDASVEVIDLRTIIPWDKETVINSVCKTGRALIVHEDTLTAGFGAEIAAQIASDAFLSLKGPVERLAVKDIPLPYNVTLLEEALPSKEEIEEKIYELLEF